MYGLVNRALEELIIRDCGAQMWDAIRRKAGLGITGFVGMDLYPDRITHELVAAASEVLGRPADDLLREFGRHWLLYTAQQGYGPLLDLAGSTVHEFLANLGEIHRRLRVSMPQLAPPQIQCHVEGEGLRVEYRSHRVGLGAMVQGLLEGVGERFDTPLLVTRSAFRDQGAACDEFVLEFKATS
jgi:hypothetical protein